VRLNFGDVDSLKGSQLQSGLLAGMLDKGGAGMTRQQIADAFDRLKAQVSFAGDEQSLTVSLNTRREQLPELITLIGKLLRQPSLEPAALEELRRQGLASVENERSDPTAIVVNLLRRHGNPYPRGDIRYAASFDEVKQDLQTLQVDGLRQFHQRFYSAANAEFAAVGDMDLPAVQQALQTAFGDWRAPAAGPRPFVRAPVPFLAIKPERLQVATPDKQNATLRLVLPMPLKELDPDYAALLLVNEMLSAGPGTRLWERMREREGLTYGVGSGIFWNSFEPHSRYLVQASFATANRAKMEQALAEEFERARKDGFTAQELERFRNGLLQERRLNRAQDAVLASSLARNLHLGRTFAVSQQVDDAIAQVTLEQANADLRKYLDPSRWALAVAGDFKSAQ
jgi:zinc protease